jgi:SAM-dependent methyltransferase
MFFAPPSAIHSSIELQGQIPQQISLERFKTLNGFGFVFLKPSPLLTDFIECEAFPGAVLMEVGAGFGNAPIEALKRGVDKYVANDLSQEHLDILHARMREACQSDINIDSSKLDLLPGKAPDILPKLNDYYDAILIDKALHFFSPEEVETFILWAHKSLKWGGHIYVLTISPYIASYREKILPVYTQNREENHPYPGYVVDADLYLQEVSRSDTNYRVPRKMYFFALRDLCAVFEQRGFIIEKTYSISLPTDENPYWIEVVPEQSSLVGIKACKTRDSKSPNSQM